MGFRFSLYCVPRETVEKYRNITSEGYESDCVYDKLTNERVMYEALTDILMHTSHGKFADKLFNNNLDVESDLSFLTISKDQLLNIIEEVRENHILKYFNGRRIDSDADLGEDWNEKTDVEEALRANQGEWNWKANMWKVKWFDEDKGIYGYHNINVDTNDKWIISGGWSYEYLIFDLIHILKIFDWENDVLVAIGG